MAAMERRCPRCGAQYEGHVDHCFVDGTALVSGAAIPSRAVPEVASAAPPSGSDERTRLLILGLGGVALLSVILAIGVGGGVALSGMGDDGGEAVAAGEDGVDDASLFLDETSVLLEEGRIDAALVLLARIEALSPTDPRIVVRLTRLQDEIRRLQVEQQGRSQIAAGDLVGARESIEALLRAAPSDSAAVELLEMLDAREAEIAAASAAPEAETKPTPKRPRRASGTRAATPQGKVDVLGPAGAVLRIDGRLIGVTPTGVKPLSAGTHHVHVSKDGFVPFEQSIEIVAQRTTPVEVALVRRSDGAASSASDEDGFPSLLVSRGSAQDPKAAPQTDAPAAGSAALRVHDVAAVRAALAGVEGAAMDRGVPASVAGGVTDGILREVEGTTPTPAVFEIRPSAYVRAIVDGHAAGQSKDRISAALRRLYAAP